MLRVLKLPELFARVSAARHVSVDARRCRAIAGAPPMLQRRAAAARHALIDLRHMQDAAGARRAAWRQVRGGSAFVMPAKDIRGAVKMSQRALRARRAIVSMFVPMLCAACHDARAFRAWFAHAHARYFPARHAAPAMPRYFPPDVARDRYMPASHARLSFCFLVSGTA